METPKHVFFAPDAPYAPLVASKPEVLAVALSIAHAAKIGWPSKQMVKWVEVLLNSYTQHPSYWWPHDVSESGVVFIKSWARGGFNYFSQFGDQAEPVDLMTLDPLDWHAGLAKRLEGLRMSEEVQIACELMCEQCDPADALYGEMVSKHLSTVRTAMERGAVVIDPDKIRRMKLRKQA